MRLMKYLVAAALLLNSTVAVAQNTTPASTSLGSFRDRTGLDKPLQGVTVLDANGNPSGQGADGQAVAVTPASSGNAVVFSADTSGYRGLTFSMYGTYSVTTSTECSNDNTSWQSCAVLDTLSNSYTSGPQTQQRAYYAPAVSRYFRLRVVSYTSGTVSAVAYLRQTNIDPGNVTISGVPSVQGNVAAGTADSGNPLKVGGVGSDAAPTAVATNQRVNGWFSRYGAQVGRLSDVNGQGIDADNLGSDIGGTANYRLRVDASLRLYDAAGNVISRVRDANNAAGTSGTGLMGVGNLMWNPATGTYIRARGGLLGETITSDLDGGAVVVTPSATNQGVILSVPTTGYAGVSFVTGTAANGGTWNFQGSNDSTNGTDGNWVTLNAQQLNNAGTSATQTANAGFFIPAVTTWVRVVVTGTITSPIGGSAALRSIAPFAFTINNQTVNNNKSQWNTEANNVALAANAAAVNGTIRDTGLVNADYRYNYFSCLLVPSAASPGLALRQLGSFDNSRFFVVQSVSVPSGTTVAAPLRTSERIFARYNRCQWDNSTSAAAVSVDVASQYGE